MLVVWRLDRLGRSVRDLLKITDELKEREIGFKSLTEQIMAEAVRVEKAKAVRGAGVFIRHVGCQY